MRRWKLLLTPARERLAGAAAYSRSRESLKFHQPLLPNSEDKMRIPLLHSRSVSSLTGTLAGVASLSLVLLAHSPSAAAQRLPQTVKPEHYALTLAPDLKTATFAGQETIDVTLAEPMAAITLNAAEITFKSVTTTVAGNTLTAKVTEDKVKQQATLTFPEKLPAGKLTLDIRYTGILNNELRGFYLSKTAKRNYAVTQFESTDARRAFPSFDEPAFKATFDITLIVDKGDTAISNTNIVKDEPVEGHVAEGEKHAITFATTPKMSTYLVALLVGDFKCLSGSSDGVPIRACATPDQVQYAAFALSTAEYALHYYDNYFGIKYPMPKLDMIGIPDFEAGAMENFGAITYRETDFLLDPAHSSVAAQRRVGLVVTHEMAHQWFGDMVTLKWWDNTWLNEGFATWMENKPLEAWKPEWDMTQEVAADNQGTLNLDSERTTRTIRAKADTPDEINEMFDGISYGKAGAMLLMVENYLGEETFRKGVHEYLAAHLYGNATAEDFWNTLAKVSGKPVDKIMDSLVSQPGVPILKFGAPTPSNVPVAQERFYMSSTVKPPKSDTAEVWTLPVCLKVPANNDCQVLSAAHQQLPTSTAPFFFANAEGKGYYRTSYAPATYQQLLPHVATDLTPEERISLAGDQWALLHSGKSTVDAYMSLVAALRNDQSGEVIDAAFGRLYTMDTQIARTPQERARLAEWVRTTVMPAYTALGAANPNDSPERLELRAALFGILGSLGKDPAIIAEARAITAKSLADPASVEQTLGRVALGIAASNGDETLFNQLLALSKTATNPQQRSNALHALYFFHDPVLEEKALAYAASGQVRNQDAPGFFAMELARRDTQDVAWQYMTRNWEKVSAQFTTFGGAGAISGVGGFCSADKINEVTTFFAAHKVAASQRTLARAKDQIRDCIDLRTAQEPNLKAWLAKQ
jgi:aminopeptidase N/puromycin-sensitive aminopeptidase